MRIRQVALPWLVVAAGCATNGTIVRAQQSPERLAVNLSDPSKPATVRVHVLMGRSPSKVRVAKMSRSRHGRAPADGGSHRVIPPASVD